MDERSASYAALGSVFFGALAFMVYQAGQLATVASAALFLNALPYFYEWSVEADVRSLIKGIAVTLAAAAAHHVTLIFWLGLVCRPGIVAGMYRCWRTSSPRLDWSSGFPCSRVRGRGGHRGRMVLLPYWIAHTPPPDCADAHSAR